MCSYGVKPKQQWPPNGPWRIHIVPEVCDSEGFWKTQMNSVNHLDADLIRKCLLTNNVESGDLESRGI